ncbi:MAG: hypothetical protein A6D92_06205 [Symbiobacterium thermophilum]|uniref:Uncharacterized protein n=1 Tax=Symbiobacterium thermophilum TaxID=2734 RepID=A0A1Y2T8A6_SYMTR|nr:MAG: hypothetical protein A6D92_06205 [Symbiobacterium thermophilum]
MPPGQKPRAAPVPITPCSASFMVPSPPWARIRSYPSPALACAISVAWPGRAVGQMATSQPAARRGAASRASGSSRSRGRPEAGL